MNRREFGKKAGVFALLALRRHSPLALMGADRGFMPGGEEMSH